MTFGQWFSRYAAKANEYTAAIYSHRFVYAAGVPALVTEVEEYYIRSFPRRSVVSFDLSRDVPWFEVEQVLSRFVGGGACNVVVLRRPDKADPFIWKALTEWVRNYSAHYSRTFLLALGDELWATPQALKASGRARSEVLAEDVRAPVFLTARGSCYVECNPLTIEAQAMYAHRRLQGRLGVQVPSRSGRRRRRAQPSPAAVLVSRCGGDVNRLRSEVAKLELLTTGVITTELVEALVQPSPGEEYVEALVAGEKARAVEAAPLVTSVRGVLALLDSRVTYLFLIREALRVLGRKVATRTLAQYLNLDPYVVMLLRDRARSYDLTSVARRYAALVQAGRSIREGAPPASVLVVLAEAW